MWLSQFYASSLTLICVGYFSWVYVRTILQFCWPAESRPESDAVGSPVP